MIGSTSSQKTAKEPKAIKIDSSVIAGKRQPHELNDSQHKHKDENMSLYTSGITKIDDARHHRNAETSDTFNRNTEAPQTDYAYSKLSQIYLGGLKTSSHGPSPFQNQSQKQPKSRKFEYQ